MSCTEFELFAEQLVRLILVVTFAGVLFGLAISYPIRDCFVAAIRYLVRDRQLSQHPFYDKPIPVFPLVLAGWFGFGFLMFSFFGSGVTEWVRGLL